jgi:hypothetical protein
LILSLIAFIGTGQDPHIAQGALLILPISYLSALIIGAPAVYILHILKKVQIWHYISAGALASFTPIFLILIYPFIIHYSSPYTSWVPADTMIALMMATSGIVVAATFWVVTRPDLASEK